MTKVSVIVDGNTKVRGYISLSREKMNAIKKLFEPSDMVNSMKYEGRLGVFRDGGEVKYMDCRLVLNYKRLYCDLSDFSDGDIISFTKAKPPTATSTPEVIDVLAEGKNAGPTASGRAKVKDAHLIFLLDTSGSMEGEKLESAKTDGLDFVENECLTHKTMSVITFADRVEVIEKRMECSDIRDVLYEDLKYIEAEGGTALWDSIGTAVQMARTGEKTDIIVVTDGEDTRSERYLEWQDVFMFAQSRNVDVHLFIVGIGKNVDEEMLDDAARAMGGAYINVGPTSEGISGGFNTVKKASRHGMSIPGLPLGGGGMGGGGGYGGESSNGDSPTGYGSGGGAIPAGGAMGIGPTGWTQGKWHSADGGSSDNSEDADSRAIADIGRAHGDSRNVKRTVFQRKPAVDSSGHIKFGGNMGHHYIMALEGRVLAAEDYLNRRCGLHSGTVRIPVFINIDFYPRLQELYGMSPYNHTTPQIFHDYYEKDKDVNLSNIAIFVSDLDYSLMEPERPYYVVPGIYILVVENNPDYALADLAVTTAAIEALVYYSADRMVVAKIRTEKLRALCTVLALLSMEDDDMDKAIKSGKELEGLEGDIIREALSAGPGLEREELEAKLKDMAICDILDACNTHRMF